MINIFNILVCLATIVAGVIAAIQLWEWWRNRTRVRKHRIALEASRMDETSDIPLQIINFSHPITDNQLKQLKNTTQRKISTIIDVKTHLDEIEQFDKQIKNIVDKVGFTSEQWQEGNFLINLPGLSQASALLLAEIHGRMGHFPSIIRLKPSDDGSTRIFELAEVVNLQNVRDDARKSRLG